MTVLFLSLLAVLAGTASLGDLVQLVLDNPQLVGAALGLLAPALVEAVKQPSFSVKQQRLLAYGVSALIGLLTVVSLGTFDLADLTSTILLTIATSQATYAEFWRPTGAAAAIADKTTIGSSSAPATQGAEDPAVPS